MARPAEQAEDDAGVDHHHVAAFEHGQFPVQQKVPSAVGRYVHANGWSSIEIVTGRQDQALQFGHEHRFRQCCAAWDRFALQRERFALALHVIGLAPSRFAAASDLPSKTVVRRVVKLTLSGNGYRHRRIVRYWKMVSRGGSLLPSQARSQSWGGSSTA